MIVALLKGVPARTTQVVTVGGVLRREQMEIVMNPHDARAIEAADYVKRRVGGKVIALSMGPEVKVAPIMADLYDENPESRLVPRMATWGVDETVLLSDRRMAGADTLATAYTVSLGVKKLLDVNIGAIDELMRLLGSGVGLEQVRTRALELYNENLLPNKVFSALPSVKSSIIGDYVAGSASREEALRRLEEVKRSLQRFIVLAGIKTTDGETGSTGPQVAEGLSDIYGYNIPHITYVHEFEIYPEKEVVIAERKIGGIVQVLECPLPAILTISPEYRPRVPPAEYEREARANNYKGKLKRVVVWNAAAIEADPNQIGLPGSPTLVGPGVEVAKPPIQKVVNQTLVFRDRVEAFEWNGIKYGPFERGDVASNLPADLLGRLKEEKLVETFTLERFFEELFRGLLVSARAVYREVEEKRGYKGG